MNFKTAARLGLTGIVLALTPAACSTLNVEPPPKIALHPPPPFAYMETVDLTDYLEPGNSLGLKYDDEVAQRFELVNNLLENKFLFTPRIEFRGGFETGLVLELDSNLKIYAKQINIPNYSFFVSETYVTHFDPGIFYSQPYLMFLATGNKSFLPLTNLQLYSPIK